MISSILIIAFSLALLVYWFRYTCLLILRTRTSFDYAANVVAANNLKFHEVQREIEQKTEGLRLDPLHESLARDYRLLTYLLRHTSGIHVAGLTLEQRLLMFDFRLMQTWYALAGRFAASQSRSALREMSHILSHLANAMGERAAAGSRS